MADDAPVAPAYNAVTGAVQPSQTVFSPVATGGTSTKKMSPEDMAALQQLQAAQAAQQGALTSLAPVADLPNEADLAAGMASREQSAQVAPKTDEAIAPRPPGATLDDQLEQRMSEAAPLQGVSERNAPRYSSQQLAAAPAMQTPATLEARQDEAAKDEARYKAKVATETQNQLQAIETQKAERLQAAQAEYAKLSRQYAQGGQVAFAPTMAQRFAVALGSFGAGLTGGPNFAQQMLEKQMQLDADRQKQQLGMTLERLKMAGASQEQIMQFAQQSTVHAQAMQTAKLDAFHQQVNQILAPFPQFQQAADQKLAAMKAEQAEKALNAIKDMTGKTVSTGFTGAHTATVTGDKSQGSAGDKASEGLKLAGLESSAKIAAEFAKTGGPSADALETARDNAARIAGGRKMEAEGGGGIAKAEAFRFLGIVPNNVANGMSHEEGQQVLRARKFFDDVSSALVSKGVLPPDQAGQWVEGKVSGLYSATPDERKAFWKDWSERVGGATAVSGKRQERVTAGMNRAGAETSQSNPVTMNGTSYLKLSPAERADYHKANAVKPGAPNYQEAQRVVQILTRKAAGGTP
jgi:hypothetical protein